MTDDQCRRAIEQLYASTGALRGLVSQLEAYRMIPAVVQDVLRDNERLLAEVGTDDPSVVL